MKHMIPNTLGMIIVAITFDIPGYIFSEAFLSYVGLGIQPATDKLGSSCICRSAELYVLSNTAFVPGNYDCPYNAELYFAW